MDEEDIKFEAFIQLMDKRSEMRRLLVQAVEAFNAFNERELPGQYLPMILAIKHHNNTIKEIYK